MYQHDTAFGSVPERWVCAKVNLCSIASHKMTAIW